MTQHTNPPNPSPPRPRQRQGQVSGIQIVFASILAIGLLLTINFSGRIRRGQQIEEVRRNLEATISVLSNEQTRLQEQRDYALSPNSVIEWAQREGKMVREGEVLVVPIPAGQLTTPTPQATPIPLATPSPVPVEYVWWKLFFDQEPPFGR